MKTVQFLSINKELNKLFSACSVFLCIVLERVTLQLSTHCSYSYWHWLNCWWLSIWSCYWIWSSNTEIVVPFCVKSDVTFNTGIHFKIHSYQIYLKSHPKIVDHNAFYLMFIVPRTKSSLKNGNWYSTRRRNDSGKIVETIGKEQETNENISNTKNFMSAWPTNYYICLVLWLSAFLNLLFVGECTRHINSSNSTTRSHTIQVNCV